MTIVDTTIVIDTYIHQTQQLNCLLKKKKWLRSSSGEGRLWKFASIAFIGLHYCKASSWILNRAVWCYLYLTRREFQIKEFIQTSFCIPTTSPTPPPQKKRCLLLSILFSGVFNVALSTKPVRRIKKPRFEEQQCSFFILAVGLSFGQGQ